jgi:hypothetical protein
MSISNETYDSFLANKYNKPLYIRPYTAAPGGSSTYPSRIVWRYTATAAANLQVQFCINKNGTTGDGIDAEMFVKGQSVKRQILLTGKMEWAVPTSVAAGDVVELRVGPNVQTGSDNFAYRARMVTAADAASVGPVPCP